MLNKLISISHIFIPKKKKLSMSFDSLVKMSKHINMEIKDNYLKGNFMHKIIFYDNSDTGGDLQYEILFKPFKQQNSGKKF